MLSFSLLLSLSYGMCVCFLKLFWTSLTVVLDTVSCNIVSRYIEYRKYQTELGCVRFEANICSGTGQKSIAIFIMEVRVFYQNGLEISRIDSLSSCDIMTSRALKI